MSKWIPSISINNVLKKTIIGFQNPHQRNFFWTILKASLNMISAPSTRMPFAFSSSSYNCGFSYNDK